MLGQYLKGDCQKGYDKKNFDESNYKGEYKNGLVVGNVDLLRNYESELYVGVSKNILLHVEGTYYYANGDISDGTRPNGKIKGRGTYSLADDRKYLGENIESKRYEKGAYSWPSGALYLYPWPDNNLTGWSLYTVGNDSEFKSHTYLGEMAEGTLNDLRKYSFSCENVSEADYVIEKIEENGMYAYPDGPKYQGEFKDSEWHGKGTIIWPGGNRFEGNFENGNPIYGRFYRHGELLYTGKIDKASQIGAKNIVYINTGGFVQLLDNDNQVSSIRYDNGDYFIGRVFIDWWGDICDEPFGEGVFIFSDGKAIIGAFNREKVATWITEEIIFEPSKAELWYMYGIANQILGYWNLAELEYQRAQRLEQKNEKYVLALVEALGNQNEFAIAMTYVDAILKANPKNLDAIYNRAWLFFRQNDFDNSLEQFDALVKLDANNFYYHYGRGLCYFEKQDYEKAISDFTASIEIQETQVALFYRGISYLNSNRKIEACRDLQNAKALGFEDIDSDINRACN